MRKRSKLATPWSMVICEYVLLSENKPQASGSLQKKTFGFVLRVSPGKQLPYSNLIKQGHHRHLDEVHTPQTWFSSYGKTGWDGQPPVCFFTQSDPPCQFWFENSGGCSRRQRKGCSSGTVLSGSWLVGCGAFFSWYKSHIT